MIINESNPLQERLNAPDCPFIGRCSCWERPSVCDEGPSAESAAQEREAPCVARPGSLPARHARDKSEAAR
jgi:hypothetical protein